MVIKRIVTGFWLMNSNPGSVTNYVTLGKILKYLSPGFLIYKIGMIIILDL